jgi:hypothetical protein
MRRAHRLVLRTFFHTGTDDQPPCRPWQAWWAVAWVALVTIILLLRRWLG